MKLDRLVSILVLLLRRDRIPAREMAELFGVSVRTILRDVEAINLAGIPIVTYQGMGGGIGIAEGYRIDRSLLTADDLAALLASLKGVASSVPDSRHTVLLEKLQNTVAPSQLHSLQARANQLVIDLSPWGGSGSIKALLAELRKAISARQLIRFVYADSGGKQTERQLEPYSLVLKGMHWYLYGWCLLRRDFRFFRLTRMQELTVTETVFTAREIAVDQLPWETEWQKPDNLIELELLFDRELESTAWDWFGAEIVRAEDGRLMVKATMPENNWLYGFLLSFGPGLEVVRPTHLRAILAKTAQAIYQKYTPET